MKKQDIYIRAVRIENGRSAATPAHLLRDLRRADDFIRLAVVAGAGVLEPVIDAAGGPAKIGVFLGTTTGPLETNFRFLDTLFDNGEGQASPTLFSHSVHNAAVGYVARLLDIQGPALTVTTPGWPFLGALAEAKTALETMELGAALALAVEEEGPLLAEARERRQTPGPVEERTPAPCRLGAVAWLLTTTGGKEDPRLQEIAWVENPCDPAFYLCRDHECFQPSFPGPDCGRFPRSLAAALSLTEKLQEVYGREKSFSWTATALWGRASVLVE